MDIVVNGETRIAPEGQTLLELLLSLQLEPARVAVEFDRRIAKPSEWETLVLRSGSKLEIVQFVGGG